MAFASGSSGGYFVMAFILCLPSFFGIGFLIWYIADYAKSSKQQKMKAWLISFFSLLLFGICFPGNGGFLPNWFAYMNGEFASSIFSSLIGSIFLLMLYVLKLGSTNESRNNDESNESN